jgi:hypothetical protein
VTLTVTVTNLATGESAKRTLAEGDALSRTIYGSAQHLGICRVLADASGRTVFRDESSPGFVMVYRAFIE